MYEAELLNNTDYSDHDIKQRLTFRKRKRFINTLGIGDNGDLSLTRKSTAVDHLEISWKSHNEEMKQGENEENECGRGISKRSSLKIREAFLSRLAY